ncbi:MAG TPA: D-arabinono-1,4-lactone oxidase, partial [Thermoanaerobaculia bacterium]|nr:D-arabinono-1,4-lactone oxidase [Thermoanaerobaculia bacterium]
IGRLLAPMIPLVNAAMLAAWGFLLAIPFVGPILFGVATATWVALMTAMGAIVSGSAGANLGEVLARIASLAASVRQSWIVRDLVSMMIGTMRGPLPNGFVIADGFRLMTGQQGCPDNRTEPLCMRQIDGLEFAFNASGGQFRYLDFIDAVSALLTELLDRHQPAGAGISIRFTRGSEALLAMQQFPMTVTIEIFSLRGLPGSDEFLRRVQSLAAAHGGIPHWGLIHDLTEAEVARLYGENHTMWRRVLGRLIDEGSGRAETFSTNFSVRRGLEPLFGCVLPAPLGRLLLDILRAIARIRR